MNTQKDQAAGQGGPGSLFDAEASAAEEGATAESESRDDGPAAAEEETDLGGPDAGEGEAEPAEDEAEDEDDVAAGATAAAQVAVDAPAGGGGPAAASRPSTPLPPSSRVLPDEDEPYVFKDCTVTISIQLLPDDGDEDGREVIIGVSSHIEGPLLELTRLRLLGALPPPVAELVRLHEERLPGLGEARAGQRQRETASKSSAARSKTTVRGANGKAATPAKPAPAGASATPASQTSLFDLNTGHRPKAAETTAAGAS